MKQGDRTIYCFAVDGKQLPRFTAVSRIHRDHRQRLLGYQRPEVTAHIRSIRRYLESDDPLMPNALVIACDRRISFIPTAVIHTASSAPYCVPGELVIPIDETWNEVDKPAWLVDGQQRAAAIRDANVSAFPVAVVAFIAENRCEQRAQFVLVNNTKPLPKGLIHELLPAMDGTLPPRYARKQLPAAVMARLNTTPGGPFHGLIASPTAPNGYIKDNSVLKMIENSLFYGALYQYRSPLDGTGNLEAMLAHLNAYWGLVRDLWPTAWALRPRESRLTHGVGVQAMGYVMDHLTEDLPADKVASRVAGPLNTLLEATAWTSGTWQIDGHHRSWRDLQNTPTDLRQLTEHLLRVLDRRPPYGGRR